MPYYRIVVWTKRRKAPFVGIRLIGEVNINTVQQTIQSKSIHAYRNDFIDVEVQMLSKLSNAIKAHLRKLEG